MLSKIATLARHPYFHAAPGVVLGRVALWGMYVLRGKAPEFALTSAGEKLQVPADMSYTSLTSFIWRDHVEPELAQLHRFVKPGDVFVDVGANIGLFTLRAASLVGPSGWVVAVEPGQVSGQRLAANLARNHFTNIRIIPRAVSDTVGQAALHHVAMGNDPQAFSLLSNGDGLVAETVATCTLDSLVAELGLPRVDCIKIDVEGAEPLVVAGGQDTLRRFRPKVIFEINADVISGSAAPDRCFQMLAAMGYGLWQWRGDRLVQVAAQPPGHGNLVAIHPDRPGPGAAS